MTPGIVVFTGEDRVTTAQGSVPGQLNQRLGAYWPDFVTCGFLRIWGSSNNGTDPDVAGNPGNGYFDLLLVWEPEADSKAYESKLAAIAAALEPKLSPCSDVFVLLHRSATGLHEAQWKFVQSLFKGWRLFSPTLYSHDLSQPTYLAVAKVLGAAKTQDRNAWEEAWLGLLGRLSSPHRVDMAANLYLPILHHSLLALTGASSELAMPSDEELTRHYRQLAGRDMPDDIRENIRILREGSANEIAGSLTALGEHLNGLVNER